MGIASVYSFMETTAGTHVANGRILLTDGGEDDDSSTENDDEQNGQGDGGESDGTGGETGSASDDGTSVLFLDLEGLFLDVLGLEVDLEEVELEVEAVRGSGNFLGNLLSGVAGLLDTGPVGLLKGLFDDIIGGLSGGSEGEGDSLPGLGVTSQVRSSVDDLPIEELLRQVIAELVSQVLDESSTSAAETEDAAGDETRAEAET